MFCIFLLVCFISFYFFLSSALIFWTNWCKPSSLKGITIELNRWIAASHAGAKNLTRSAKIKVKTYIIVGYLNERGERLKWAILLFTVHRTLSACFLASIIVFHECNEFLHLCSTITTHASSCIASMFAHFNILLYYLWQALSKINLLFTSITYLKSALISCFV